MSAPRTVVVTGAASGIGQETCRQFASRGDTVIGFDVALGEFVTRVVDVVEEDAVRESIDEVVESNVGLDVLCNVAGIGASGDVTANPLEEWRHVFDVNVLGTVTCSRAAIPHMRRRGGGCIVNVSSVVALIGLTDRALYSATKGAVSALTRAMAADHVHEGIRVNAVCPGTVDTPWVRRLLAATEDPEGLLEGLRQRQPMGRLGTADEVAAAILYLASEEAAFVTGTELVIDGGISGLLVRPPSR